MELAERFKRVLMALDEAEVPTDLREPAFVKGMDALEGAVASPKQTGDQTSKAVTAATSDLEDAVERIAVKMGIDSELAHEVFHDDEGRLGIGIAPSRLAKSHASATKQLALLLAAGRQAGGYDDGYTPVAEIREMCRDFSRLDSGNFSSTITEMDEEFTFKGKGPGRQVHVTKPGWGKARDLVISLTNGG